MRKADQVAGGQGETRLGGVRGVADADGVGQAATSTHSPLLQLDFRQA